MNVISINNLSFHYTGDMIFEDISLEFEKNKKVGLIGPNGSGKSTLFKLILGELSPVSGEIYISKDQKIGYLHQEETVSKHNSVYQEALEAFKELILIEEKINMLSREISIESDQDKLHSLILEQSYLNEKFLAFDGVTYENRTKAVLKGLGFSEEQLDLEAIKLSGGQKTRLALAKLLLQKPDILLLDEPTNHLDFDSISWLETFLSDYPGLVAIISHDRYFLDMVTNMIVEIENRNIYSYDGNYTASRDIRKANLQAYQNAYDKQAAKIDHLNAVIKKLKQFNREKSIKRARSFEKKLGKLDQMDPLNTKDKKIKVSFSNTKTHSKDILFVTGLSKRYSDNVLFSDLNFSVFKGDRLFVLGPNGSGKSTLLKIVTGQLDADNGKHKIGQNISYGYYDQDQTFSAPNKTIFDEIYDEFPHLTKTEVMNSLAGMLFTGDDHEKRIKTLSGGEKARISLLKLMLFSTDFMILDEPTNHLDIFSREKLEDALAGYDGTLLVVSHDRYFIKKLANQILYLENSTHRFFQSGYDEFVLQLKNEQKILDQNISIVSDSKLAYQEEKKKQAVIRKLESDISRLFESITDYDDLLNEVERDIINANEADYMTLSKLTQEKEKIESECLESMEKMHTLELELKEII